MNHDIVYKELVTWLNDNRPDYDEGLAILMSYEDKPALCAQLRQYKNPTKLRESLVKLFEKVKTKMANPVPDKKEVRKILVEVKKDPEAVPKDKVLRELHIEGIGVMKEIDSVKGTLYMIGRNPASEQTMPLSDEDIKQRFTLARILVGDGGLNDKWKKIQANKVYYNTTGEVPVVVSTKTEIVVTGDYLEKENCRKQISKLKRKISKAKINVQTITDEDERLSILADINVWEAKLGEEGKKMELIKKKANVKSD